MNDEVVVVTPKILNIARAIAFAEGFGVPNAIPTRYNNPGDLVGSDGKKIVFASVEAGWSALYRQIHLMITGMSRVYKPTMAWEQIGKLYDGEDGYMAWVNNVTGKLGVAPTSTLDQYMAAA